MTRRTGLPGGVELNLERRLSYRFAILSARIVRTVAKMYGPKYGLLPSGWKTMAAIGRYGPVSAKEVCAHITVEPHKITRSVDRLVERGYVRREQDAADRRRVVLTLTPNGRKAYESIEFVTRTVELSLLRALSLEERRTLSRLLAKLEVRARKSLGDSQDWRMILKEQGRDFRSD